MAASVINGLSPDQATNASSAAPGNLPLIRPPVFRYDTRDPHKTQTMASCGPRHPHESRGRDSAEPLRLHRTQIAQTRQPSLAPAANRRSMICRRCRRRPTRSRCRPIPARAGPPAGDRIAAVLRLSRAQTPMPRPKHRVPPPTGLQHVELRRWRRRPANAPPRSSLRPRLLRAPSVAAARASPVRRHPSVVTRTRQLGQDRPLPVYSRSPRCAISARPPVAAAAD